MLCPSDHIQPPKFFVEIKRNLCVFVEIKYKSKSKEDEIVIKVALSLFRKDESSPCDAADIELSPEEVTLLLNSDIVQFPFEEGIGNFKVTKSTFNIEGKFCIIYLREI